MKEITQEELAKFVEREVVGLASDIVDRLREKDEDFFQIELDAMMPVNSIEDAEPTYPEIFEYWFVTDWFAEKLKEKRETIIDEFALKIWGRTCTGQAIYLDSIIEEIYRELHKD